jgi:hypothetical protein
MALPCQAAGKIGKGFAAAYRVLTSEWARSRGFIAFTDLAGVNSAVTNYHMDAIQRGLTLYGRLENPALIHRSRSNWWRYPI